MSAIDERNAIMELANRINELRMELHKVIGEMNQGISMLVAKADSLMLKVADEHSAGIKPTVTTGLSSQHPTAEEVAEFTTGGRKCGLCGERGHNARTCPNAHKVKEEKKETRPEGTRGKRKCGNCGEYGHNTRTCNKL